MTTSSKLALFSIVLIFLSFGSSRIDGQNKEIDFYSYNNRVKFGNHLFCSDDYLRAIDEYLAALRLRENDTARFKVGISLRELGRYSEAEDYFRALYFNSDLIDEAILETYKTLYFSDNLNELENRINGGLFFTDKYENEIRKLGNVSYLYPGRRLIDSTDFFRPFNQTESIELLKFYMRKKYPDRKNPTTAALLSAVIPGLGKIYTDEYTDGITSFLLTGVLTFLAVDNFNAGHDFRGWLFTGLAAYFYAGNIYGSFSSAQIYNATVQFNFQNDLKIFLNQKNHFMPEYDFLCK